MKYIIYADGSSLGNPGKGGYAFLIFNTETKKISEYGGAVQVATNNQMELKALIEALKVLNFGDIKVGEGDVLEMRLDSQYVIKGSTEWYKGWVKNGWMTAAKKAVLNKNYWLEILNGLEMLKDKGIKINFVHVLGHNGEEGNERVDEIARTMASGKVMDLRK